MTAIPRICFTLCVVATLPIALPAAAQTSGGPAKTQEDLIAETHHAMGCMIETADLQDELPFAEFLDKLNRQLQKRAKISVRFDRAAFGKEADKMLAKHVRLPPVPKSMNASTAVRLALAQTYTVYPEIEFMVRPGEFVITTRDRAFFTATYDVRDLLKSTQRLHDEIVAMRTRYAEDDTFRPIDERADPKKPGEWLVRQILRRTDAEGRAGWRGQTPASTIRVENGAKLIVHTVPSIHANIRDLLESLQRLADLHVVMNARLYEVDRVEFDKHFAPAFVDPNNKSSRPIVVKATDPLVKKLKGRKAMFESDPDKLIPGRRAPFLSMRNAFQFQAKPGERGMATDFEGFTFTVRPTVSPDRRCIRLELSQDVARLVEITKGTMVDLKTGKDVPIELPNVRKTTAAAAIEIHDEQAILMSVSFQPAVKGKVWLMLAEPMIYMEEEQVQIHKDWIPSRSGVTIPRMPMADEKPQAPEPPVVEADMPAKPAPILLPDSDDVKQILQAIVENIMTDPQLKGNRDFYGTARDKNFALDHNSSILWPKHFHPKVAGYTMQPIEPDECLGFRNRLLGIRLDGFTWDAKKPNAKEVHIDVAIHNVGGHFNGAPIGGCHIAYVAKREGKRWLIQWSVID